MICVCTGAIVFPGRKKRNTWVYSGTAWADMGSFPTQTLQLVVMRISLDLNCRPLGSASSDETPQGAHRQTDLCDFMRIWVQKKSVCLGTEYLNRSSWTLGSLLSEFISSYIALLALRACTFKGTDLEILHNSYVISSKSLEFWWKKRSCKRSQANEKHANNPARQNFHPLCPRCSFNTGQRTAGMVHVAGADLGSQGKL